MEGNGTMIKAHTWSGDLNILAADRRQYMRISAAIQTELRPDGTNVPMRLQTSDVSLGGCYVEMALTMAVGSRLSVVLWLDQTKMTLRGVVVTCHPQFGNGIQFVGMSEEDTRLLAYFLDSRGGYCKKT